MTDPRTQLVAETYDAIADRFAGWRDEVVMFREPEGDVQFQWILGRT